MPLSGLQPQDITEAALRGLIEAKVPEGKTIDYKAELPGNADSARKDFLADLSSFANASGGHIVYGMKEAKGLPTKLVGVADDIDQAILRMESMARDGIRPPIPGLRFVKVDLADGNAAIVVIVPKSWNPPHQVVFQKDYRFYARGSAGKQHFDVDELRGVFLLSQEVGERIRQFRAGRIAAVMSGETPVPMLPGARVILHFVPYAAFGIGTVVDFKPLLADRGRFMTLTNRGGSMRHNVDGLLAYSHAGDSHDVYAQLYRDGILEIVVQIDEHKPRTRVVLPSEWFEKEIFAFVSAALSVLKLAGVMPPVAVLLTFTGIKGWNMGVHDPWGTRGHAGGFDRDPLLIPDMLLQSLEADDVRKLVRPLLDHTWQAAGFEQSDYYDEQGNWVGVRR